MVKFEEKQKRLSSIKDVKTTNPHFAELLSERVNDRKFWNYFNSKIKEYPKHNMFGIIFLSLL